MTGPEVGGGLALADLLSKAAVDATGVLVLRHRPLEPRLRQAFGWLAAEKPDLFRAFQARHFVRAEQAMAKAHYVAACIGHRPGRALFVRLYRLLGSRPIGREEFWAMPEHRALAEHGMSGWSAEEDRKTSLFFELEDAPELGQWSGRLDLAWPPPERSWFRWAGRNTFPIEAIHDRPLLRAEMPPWDELVLTLQELRLLPAEWAARLAEWRGIYLITDESDGRYYVGSAYGGDNILSRWRSYARTGHGGNRDLKGREAEGFRFSILQRVSPDLDPARVIRLESTWKRRLHTREFGLNAN